MQKYNAYDEEFGDELKTNNPTEFINSTTENTNKSRNNQETLIQVLVTEEVETLLKIFKSNESLNLSSDEYVSRLLGERRRSRAGVSRRGDGGSRTDKLMFRTLQDKLHSKINELIDSFRITAKEALLRFDLREARCYLETWAIKIPPGDVRTRMKAVANSIDYGYNLITANKIIPLVMAAKLMNIGSSKPENRIISARSANKQITKEHDMFGTISFLLKELEWLANSTNSEKERLLAVNRARRGWKSSGAVQQKSDSVIDKAYIHTYIHTYCYYS